MASKLDQKSLEQAFEGRSDIQSAVRAAAGMFPSIVLYFPCSDKALLTLNLTADPSSHKS
jgi:hypothetical protein